MGSIFENDAAFEPMNETVVWRQDKAPHLEGAFEAAVVHGEGESESAGHSRGGMAADPYSVICASNPAEVVGMVAGDTLTLMSGIELTVQQISRDPALGWVIKATANERAPR